MYASYVHLGLDIFCREKTGFVLLRSVEAALIVLSGDTLSAKHRGLNHVYKIHWRFYHMSPITGLYNYTQLYLTCTAISHFLRVFFFPPAALFQLAVSCSRRQGTEDAFVSRAGLRNLLDDLSQVRIPHLMSSTICSTSHQLGFT